MGHWRRWWWVLLVLALSSFKWNCQEKEMEAWAFLVIFSLTNNHYHDFVMIINHLVNCHLKHLIVRLDRFLCKSVKKLSADLLGKHKLHLNQHRMVVVTQS